jgi:hypothetical protein
MEGREVLGLGTSPWGALIYFIVWGSVAVGIY